MRGDPREAFVLEIAAGVSALGGLVVAPIPTLAVLALAGAVVFAGSRRLALVVIVILALGGVAGLSVADSRRSSVSAGAVTR